MNIFNYTPAQIVQIGTTRYYCFDQQESVSPFTKNEYDFDTNFYNGSFEFESPLTKELLYDTPEAYGRHRVAAYLHESISKNTKSNMAILDIGSGSADLARIIPLNDRPRITVINSDVSGPQSELGAKSLLVKGMEKLGDENNYKEVINVQYDFNESEWPFKENSFDFVCSNMALHHIKGNRKSLISQKIFDSLKDGGTLVLNDVYDFNLDRVMFTKEGKKGPIECTGSVESLKSTLERLRKIGFKLNDISLRVEEDERSYTEKDLKNALLDTSEILPVSKAVWYLTVVKP